jgi:hypothetical protein
MNFKEEYVFVNYLEYHGGVESVVKMMSHCGQCGAKFLLSHMVDYKNYLIQETSKCLDCGQGSKKVLHPLN